MIRTISGALLGALIAFATVFAIEWLSHQIFPPPPGMDPADPDSIARAIPAIRLPAKLLVTLAWLIGTVAGGIAAVRISAKHWAAWIVAGVVLLATIANLAMIPHPLWMAITGILAPIAGGWLAARRAARRLAT